MKIGAVRLLTIAMGVVSAVSLARSGLAFFLTSFLNELLNLSDYWLSTALRFLDVPAEHFLALLKQLGLEILPSPRHHWKHVLVLMSLLFSSYVRATATSNDAGRNIFHVVWGGACALLASVLAGTVFFSDPAVFFWAASGGLAFVAGSRAWDATLGRPGDVGWLSHFGLLGVFSFIFSVTFVLFASRVVTIEFVSIVNAAATDFVPSPALALLVFGVIALGVILAIFGFPRSVSNFNNSLEQQYELPGRAMGLNVLMVLGMAASVVGASRLVTVYLEPADTICSDCPQMIELPAGSMNYQGFQPYRIASFAISATEVTQGQFRKFVEATGYVVDGYCDEYTSFKGSGSISEGSDSSGPPGDWRDPQFPPPGDSRMTKYTEDHPVVCVSLHDARAYARWLSDRTKQQYRMPTMFEWDYAAWGGQLPAVTQEIADSPTFLCRFSNLPQSTCNDGYEYTAPVGRLAAYRNGLFDMFGNVWEWTDSCMNGVLGGFDDSLGQILLGGNCFEHNYLGGSFAENPNLVARDESNAPATTRSRDMGFRVVRVH